MNKISNLVAILEEIKLDANDKHEVVFCDEDIKLVFLGDEIWVYFNNGVQHLEYSVSQKKDLSFRFDWED